MMFRRQSYVRKATSWEDARRHVLFVNVEMIVHLLFSIETKKRNALGSLASQTKKRVDVKSIVTQMISLDLPISEMNAHTRVGFAKIMMTFLRQDLRSVQPFFIHLRPRATHLLSLL